MGCRIQLCVLKETLQTLCGHFGASLEPLYPMRPSRGVSVPRLLEEAMSGQYLSGDFSLPCPPGLDIPEEQRYTITANTLKVSLPAGWEPCMPQEEQDPAQNSVPSLLGSGQGPEGVESCVFQGVSLCRPSCSWDALPCSGLSTTCWRFA